MGKEGKYIYCIALTGGRPERFGPLGVGGNGDEVYAINFRDISAVVSDCPAKRLPLSRENAFCHMKVIEEVMKRHDVLPVRFCTIAESGEKTLKILEKEYDGFIETMNKIRGKRELGLKAILKERIYDDILNSHKEIRELKEDVSKRPSEATQYLMIKIGRMVEAALEQEKERYKDIILGALKGISDKVRVNRDIGDRMALNAAFLVESSRAEDFDGELKRLDERFGDKMKFKYAAGLPPFNFVNLRINVGEY
jgi:Gas vesicle synthesis protein GvpL/GvpF